MFKVYTRCVAIPWGADRQRGGEESSGGGGGKSESDEERIKDNE